MIKPMFLDINPSLFLCNHPAIVISSSSTTTSSLLPFMSITYQIISGFVYLKTILGGFPGGSELKNLPANAGDISSIPDLG